MAGSTRLRYFAASTQGKHGSTRLKHFTAQLLRLRLRLPGLLERQRQVRFHPVSDNIQGVQVKLWYPLTMRAIPDRLRDFVYALYKSPLSLPLFFPSGSQKKRQAQKSMDEGFGRSYEWFAHMNDAMDRSKWRVLGNDNLYSRYWNSKDIYRRTRSKLRMKAIYKHRTINQKMLVIITYDHGKLQT